MTPPSKPCKGLLHQILGLAAIPCQPMCEIVKLVEERHSQGLERNRLTFRGRHMHKYVDYLPAALFPQIANNVVRGEGCLDSRQREILCQ